MQVVVHHGEARDPDRRERRDAFELIQQEVFASGRRRLISRQKMELPRTPRDHVVGLALVEADFGGSGASGHIPNITQPIGRGQGLFAGDRPLRCPCDANWPLIRSGG